MKVNQIYSLLNDINHQMWGEDAKDVHDLSGIISMGQSIVGDGTATDKFLGKLVDRIGKTVIRTLDFELDFPALFMDSYQFGAILQKITVNPFDSIENAEFKVGDNGFTPTFADIHKPDVTVKYFTDSTTAKWQVTIPDTLFKTAFTSAEMMDNFVSAIINALTDSVTLSLNDMSRTCVNNFIAEKLISGNGVINLLDGYNTLVGVGNTITAAEAMHSKEFARYATQEIRKYVKYLGQPSVLYNTDGIVRATARDNMHILMLSDMVSLFDAYLFSDSFKDLYNLPNYREVAYWQTNNGGASGVNTFGVNSSIDVIPSSEDGVVAGSKYAINQAGIVCVLADRQAIAVGLNDRRTGTFRNDIDAYTNTSMSFLQQWINDTSENGIVFLVADTVSTPSIVFDKTTLTFANTSASDQTITATVNPSGTSVTWKSSKTAVATVAAGVVSAAGTGTCEITGEITVGGKKYKASATVTVG